ncbi:Darcynin 2 [Shimazuella sp. AN120528]|uniref:darcynin family protein n=1 Tax=Shimazuella soli TaxID=1892854 RepID=UPI001F111792|nr:darcynin family protein [Shimazuella soli]MCH5584234.1 Darcynin 2 [Shimazuella soli]
MNYTMIVLTEFYPAWLALPREERREYAKDLYEIIDEFKDSVQVRIFDAEALPGAHYTDFMICETTDLKAYHFMWEKIRDSRAYSKGYFKIKDVIMGMENAFEAFETEELQMPSLRKK